MRKLIESLPLPPLTRNEKSELPAWIELLLAAMPPSTRMVIASLPVPPE